MVVVLVLKKRSTFPVNNLSQSLNTNLLCEVTFISYVSPWLLPYLASCQLFTSVFGVGPKTAEKWYRSGLRSLNDILTEPSIQLNRMQQTGTHLLCLSAPLFLFVSKEQNLKRHLQTTWMSPTVAFFRLQDVFDLRLYFSFQTWNSNCDIIWFFFNNVCKYLCLDCVISL